MSRFQTIVEESSCLEKLTNFRLPSKIVPSSQFAAQVNESVSQCLDFLSALPTCLADELEWEIVGNGRPVKLERWLSNFASAVVSLCEACETSDLKEYRSLFGKVSSQTKLFPLVAGVIKIYVDKASAPAVLVEHLIESVLLVERDSRLRARQFQNLCKMIEHTCCPVSLHSAELMLNALLTSWAALSTIARDIPQQISYVLCTSDGRSKEDESKVDCFIDFIVSALATNLQLDAAAILYHYTYEMDMLCSKRQQNTLFGKLVQFLHDQPYDAFYLDLAFCHLICFELQQEKDVPNVKKLFHPGKDAPNRSVHRSLQQIALLVVAHCGKAIDDAQIHCDGDGQDVCAHRASLAKFLDAIGDTVALHSIVFRMRDADWRDDTGPDLAQLIESIERNEYGSAYTTAAAAGTVRTNCKRYFRADLLDSALQFVYCCDEEDGINEGAAEEVMNVRCPVAANQRNSLIALHFCFALAEPIQKVMQFAAKNSGEGHVWHSFFYAVFDHYGKLLPEQNKPLDLHRGGAFCTWADAVTRLTNVVGDEHIFVKGATFLRVVMWLLVEHVRAAPHKFIVAEVFSALTVRLTRLSDALVMLTTSSDSNQQHAQRVDFDEVVKEGDTVAIRGIMNDDHTEEPLHNDPNRKLNAYILTDIVDERAQNLGEKVSLFGSCLLDVKSRLMVKSKANENSVATLKDVEDQAPLRADYGIESQGSTLEIARDVLFCMCQRSITKLLAVKSKSGAEAVKHMMAKLGEDVARQIAHYRYSLAKVWECTQSKLAWLTLKDLELFAARLVSEFGAALTKGVVDNIEKFQNNQLVALFLLFPEKRSEPPLVPAAPATAPAASAAPSPASPVLPPAPSPSPIPFFSVLNVATGQGKTLIEVCAALLYLQKQKDAGVVGAKVFIFTAFPHLAVRDQAAMAELVISRGFTSCVLRNKGTCDVTAAVTSDLIYCDSQEFVALVSAQAVESTNRGFLVMAHGSWSKHLVILDEIDVLMEKDERRSLRDMHAQYKAACGKDLSIDELRSGFYKEITGKFSGAEKELTDGTTGQIGVGLDQADAVHNTVDGLVYQLSPLDARQNPKDLVFKLQPTCFSLKWKLLDARRVIGFSGTVSAPALQKPLQYMGIEGMAGLITIVPLFFSPDRRFGDVSCVRCHGDKTSPSDAASPGEQKPKQLDWLDTAISEKIVPEKIEIRQPCATEEEWLSLIKQDVEAALQRKQAVLIFARKAVKGAVANQITAIQNRLGLQSDCIYSDADNLSDARLQQIGLEGRVSICTKIVGRGADIRVPLSMTEGLHVIIAAADYKEEILQQIGRTGRMNSKGSFSLIFMKGDELVPYPDQDQKPYFSGKARTAHNLSCSFYSKLVGVDGQAQWSEAQRTKFLWYQYLLLYTVHSKTPEEAKSELSVLGIDLN